MRILGAFLRYVLNINTIWAWMILVSLILCAVRNYLPTPATIPAGAFRPGENSITLRLTDAHGKTLDFDYRVMFGPTGPLLPLPDDPSRSREGADSGRPQLLSAESSAGGYRLTWDVDACGRHELLVNGRLAGHMRVVKLAGLTDAAFEYAKKGFEIALGLVSSMVLCLGLMKVGEDAGIVQIVARVLHPIIRLLFPQIPRDHPANGAILMNVTTSVLGLGNASTPFGLKAMQELESINAHKGVASDSQVMLLAYNTTGVALLPTTIIAARKAAGCSDPFEIIGTSLLAGSIATIVAILTAKLLGKLPFFSVQAALAEETAETSTAKPEEEQP